MLITPQTDLAIAQTLMALRDERDRLRAELADKARNYEDVIAYHQRTEESLRDIVRRLYQMCCEDWAHTNAAGHALLREARAAIGEGGTPTGKGVGR